MIRLYPSQPKKEEAKKIRLVVPKQETKPTVTTSTLQKNSASTTAFFSGAGYKPGAGTDPYSGKPLLVFKNDPMQRYDIIKDRVATTFDPTVAQKLDRTVLKNERMPSSASAKVKEKLGGTYDDELDHRISLILSGSNTNQNLHIEPGRLGGTAKEHNKLTVSLAAEVVSGKKSLLQAQRELAKAKGYTLQEDRPAIDPLVKQTGIRAVLKDVTKDVIEDWNTIKKAVSNTLERTKKAPQPAPTKPSPFNIPKQQPPQALREAASGFSKFSKSVNEATNLTLNLPGDLATEKIKDTTPAGSFANKFLAPAVGLGINILTPGPGEFNKGRKVIDKAQKGIGPKVQRVMMKAAKKGVTSKSTKEIYRLVAEGEEGLTQVSQMRIKAPPKPPYVAKAERMQETITKSNELDEKAALASIRPRTPESFFGKGSRTLTPLKAQDPETQRIFREWDRKVLVGKEKANLQLTRVEVKNEEGLQTILKYEKGIPTAASPKLKQEFDSLYIEAKSKGLKFGHVKNYVPQVYLNRREEVMEAMGRFMADEGVDAPTIKGYLNGIESLPEEISTRLKLNASFTHERVFPSYEVAMKYGLTPRHTNPAQLVAHYRNELEKTVANRELIKRLRDSGKIFPAELAPTDFKPVSLPFSEKGFYAEPKLADMLNGIFRDEDNLGFGQQIMKGISWTSRKMQEIALSAGVPRSQINFFSIGQLIKEVTSGNLKAASTFIRSHSDKATAKFFLKHADTLKRMAGEGINLGDRVGSYGKVYENLAEKGILKQLGAGEMKEAGKTFVKKSGEIYDKAFNEKVFSSFMPQLYTQTFIDAEKRFIKAGLSATKAQSEAAETVRAAFGIMENVGRGKGTEDALSAAFFAPKFREGIIRVLGNTLQSVNPLTRFGGQLNNPAFYKNRRLLAGMLLSYGMYNAINYQKNGHFMWDNPPGMEFDVMVPFGESGRVARIPFMPSFLALPRNILSGTFAAVKGDIDTAKQKYGSVLSMPLKLATELWANKDYFGREIYKDTDSIKVKIAKSAEYLGLQVGHPFMREVYRWQLKGKDGVTALLEALEIPVKLTNQTSLEKGEYYRMLDRQEKVRLDARNKVQPIYDEVQELIDEGNEDAAREIVDGLTDEEYETYKDIKATAKRKATMAAKSKIYGVVKKVDELLDTGKQDEAQAIIDKLSEADYKAYRLVRDQLEEVLE